MFAMFAKENMEGGTKNIRSGCGDMQGMPHREDSRAQLAAETRLAGFSAAILNPNLHCLGLEKKNLLSY
jgi:hypothetical protein